LLDKLRIDPPAVLLAGLVVRRDGADVTALLGSSLPLDPGSHEIVASAPGYTDWKTTITIAGEGTTANVTVAALEKHVEAPAVGKLVVSTRADAAISIDGNAVGSGRYEGALPPGGHTLRVVAPGMRVYQSEIVVGKDATRTIDVPLEPEVVAVAVDPADLGPNNEVGVSAALGVKRHADDPAVLAYRAEVLWRAQRRVRWGFYAEYGSIDASNACGTDMAGAATGSPFDFGAHDQFKRCMYALGGIEVVAHPLARGRFDPYVGIAPGFRATFIDFVPYDPTGMAGTSTSKTFPALMANVRVGVDYQPLASMPDWRIGALFEVELTVFGEEEVSGNGKTYASLFGGVRSTYGF
jgi:hypothetical protein